MARKAVNEIVPGKLYQRGQILSWPRKDKVGLVKDRKLSLIVNLWPKIDPDFSDSLLAMYMYMPVARSANMTSKPVVLVARMVAKLISNGGVALVLCEAGKTRSVFFCVLVLHYLKGIPLNEAYERVVKRVPKHRMKKFMEEFCEE